MGCGWSLHGLGDRESTNSIITRVCCIRNKTYIDPVNRKKTRIEDKKDDETSTGKRAFGYVVFSVCGFVVVRREGARRFLGLRGLLFLRLRLHLQRVWTVRQ